MIKKIIAVGFVALCAVTIPASHAQDKAGYNIDKRDLSGEWQFAYTAEKGASVPKDELFVGKIPVPGAWDDTFNQQKASSLWSGAKFNSRYKPIALPYDSKPPDASLPYLVGTGWYRKSLDVPSHWKGRSVVMRVGQTVADAAVYLNGKLIFSHSGHNTEWEVPLTAHLAFGKPNDLVIAVSNTESLGGCRLRGWQGATGGIFAPVSVKVTGGGARIASVYVRPGDGNLKWNSSLEGVVSPAASLQWAVMDGKRLVVSGLAKAGLPESNWESDATGVEYWSDVNPKFYQLVVRLVEGDKIIDEVSQPFGLRKVTVDNRTIKVNGNPTYLRGHCEHYYFPETCTPALDKETYIKRLSALKKLGFNWLRFHTWFPPDLYFQAANELGMYIQIEGQGEVMNLEQWREMVRAGRVHPSLILYCLGNEEVFDDARIKDAENYAKAMKELAPDALFAPNQGERGIIRSEKESPDKKGEANKGFGDSYAEKPFPHSPKRLEAISKFSDVMEPHIWGMLSYGSITGQWREIDKRLEIVKKPCLAHEAGINGGYLDLKLAERYKNTRIGPVLYDAARDYMKKRGVLDRAEIYYKNSVAWQIITRKDMFETVRNCQNLVGYDLLGAVDMHWHRTGYEVGIMNEFFELKPGVTVEDVLKVNGPAVLLLDEYRQQVISSGQPVEREVRLSWYNPKPVSNGKVSWTLSDRSGKVLESGGFLSPVVAPGVVASLGKIKFGTTKVEKPIKVRLDIKLTDDSGTTANHWNYWVFPQAPVVVPNPQVIVSSKLDKDLVAKLGTGARVVLLGGETLPRRKLSFQQGIGGRPEMNTATVVGRHPVTDAFPHEGYFDWQFARMIEKSTAVIFDELPVPFQPIIEVANSYKKIILQSPFFEWQVGKGRLIVCTLSLNDSYPEAAYFKALLMHYAGGGNLQPASTISEGELIKLIEKPSLPVKNLDKGDQGFDPRTLELKKKPKS
jgi:hypothetical protein